MNGKPPGVGIQAAFIALLLAVSSTVAGIRLASPKDEPLIAAVPQGFASLWPEVEPADAVEAQDRPEAWRLDPFETAKRFAREALLWPEPGASHCNPTQKGLCPPFIEPPRTLWVFAFIRGDLRIAQVWLTQPLSKGPSGIWSIVKVDTVGLGIKRRPGDTLHVPKELFVYSRLRVPRQVAFEFAAYTGGCANRILIPFWRGKGRAIGSRHLAPTIAPCEGEAPLDREPLLSGPAYGFVSAATFESGAVGHAFGGDRGTDPVEEITAIAVKFEPRRIGPGLIQDEEARRYIERFMLARLAGKGAESFLSGRAVRQYKNPANPLYLDAVSDGFDLSPPYSVIITNHSEPVDSARLETLSVVPNDDGLSIVQGGLRGRPPGKHDCSPGAACWLLFVAGGMELSDAAVAGAIDDLEALGFERTSNEGGPGSGRWPGSARWRTDDRPYQDLHGFGWVTGRYPHIVAVYFTFEAAGRRLAAALTPPRGGLLQVVIRTDI